MKKAGRPKGTRKTGRKYLNDEQLKQFLKAVNGNGSQVIRNRAMFRLCLYLGLRVGELARIRLEDIDFNEIEITIKGLKNGRKRTYPIEGNLWRKMKQWIQERKKLADCIPERKKNPYLFPHRLLHDKHITEEAINRAFKIYAGEAGLPTDFSVHCLRHSCAIELVSKGETPISIMKWMRHRSITSTQIYFEQAEFEGQAERAQAAFAKYM